MNQTDTNKRQGNQIAQTQQAIVTSPTEIAEFKQLIDEYYAAWSFAVSGSELEALNNNDSG